MSVPRSDLSWQVSKPPCIIGSISETAPSLKRIGEASDPRQLVTLYCGPQMYGKKTIKWSVDDRYVLEYWVEWTKHHLLKITKPISTVDYNGLTSD